MVRSFSWPGLIDCKLIILIVNYGKFAAEYRMDDMLAAFYGEDAESPLETPEYLIEKN